ncbi:hypothetical protein BDZ97DRAFT_1040604 [Flammula alnicola]|nr:hypothetical protein BDZ97DRAFT_1040604 [Flammula alnicola]
MLGPLRCAQPDTLLLTPSPKLALALSHFALQHPTFSMDNFTAFDELFASLEVGSPNPLSETQYSSPCDTPVDQERYGSGTTTAFCVIS